MHVKPDTLKNACELEHWVVEEFVGGLLFWQEHVLLALSTDVKQEVGHTLLIFPHLLSVNLTHAHSSSSIICKVCLVQLADFEFVLWVCLLAYYAHLLEQVVSLCIGLRKELLEYGLVDGRSLVLHHQFVHGLLVSASLNQIVSKEAEFWRARYFPLICAVLVQLLRHPVDLLKLWLWCVAHINKARLKIFGKRTAFLGHATLADHDFHELVGGLKELWIVANCIRWVDLVQLAHGDWVSSHLRIAIF